MTKYRIVRQVNDRGFEKSHEFVYSIQKKYWFGWKEVDWHLDQGGRIGKEIKKRYSEYLENNKNPLN
jgi:hypothetical protein